MSLGPLTLDGRNSQNGLKVLGGLVLLAGLLWLVGTEFMPYSWWCEYSYAQKYHVTIDLIHCLPKPKDCEWGQMPIGDKACHYNERVVIKVTQHTFLDQDLDEDMDEEEYRKATTERGRYDPPVPPRLTGVYISWVRVEDHHDEH